MQLTALYSILYCYLDCFYLTIIEILHLYALNNFCFIWTFFNFKIIYLNFRFLWFN